MSRLINLSGFLSLECYLHETLEENFMMPGNSSVREIFEQKTGGWSAFINRWIRATCISLLLCF